MVVQHHAPPRSMLLNQPALQKQYCHHVVTIHDRLQGGTRRTRIRKAERRDAGVPGATKKEGQGPETEAAFGRKRVAAISDVMAASPAKRQRMLESASPGLAAVVRETKGPGVTASEPVVARVAKRDKAFKEGHLRGSAAAAKARAKREKKVVKSAAQPQGRDKDLLEPEVLGPGWMLVREQDVKARRKAVMWRFRLTHNPVHFAKEVAKTPRSKGKGHVVLAPFVETDFGLSALIAAGFMGAFFADPNDFAKEGTEPRGITYTETWKSPKLNFHVAVSTALANDFPTLPSLLRSIAALPSSCLHFYQTEKRLCKALKRSTSGQPERARIKAFQRACILSKHQDREGADKKYKDLYIDPRTFMMRITGKVEGICPGYRQR